MHSQCDVHKYHGRSIPTAWDDHDHDAPTSVVDSYITEDPGFQWLFQNVRALNVHNFCVCVLHYCIHRIYYNNNTIMFTIEVHTNQARTQWHCHLKCIHGMTFISILILLSYNVSNNMLGGDFPSPKLTSLNRGSHLQARVSARWCNNLCKIYGRSIGQNGKKRRCIIIWLLNNFPYCSVPF